MGSKAGGVAENAEAAEPHECFAARSALSVVKGFVAAETATAGGVGGAKGEASTGGICRWFIVDAGSF
jgi:hypothetical protein